MGGGGGGHDSKYTHKTFNHCFIISPLLKQLKLNNMLSKAPFLLLNKLK